MDLNAQKPELGSGGLVASWKSYRSALEARIEKETGFPHISDANSERISHTTSDLNSQLTQLRKSPPKSPLRSALLSNFATTQLVTPRSSTPLSSAPSSTASSWVQDAIQRVRNIQTTAAAAAAEAMQQATVATTPTQTNFAADVLPAGVQHSSYRSHLDISTLDMIFPTDKIVMLRDLLIDITNDEIDRLPSNYRRDLLILSNVIQHRISQQ
eukprot:TRINITY_DN14259_c0_g1_i1.p1 TRINITY_DN14259_c0_g1~~TRINITY_DN14259_c0_g1_i1.p1  ORF type:complete len:213 (+),score=28.07 TRINITY_DN14259_c0_g1_i1:113-751(+)